MDDLQSMFEQYIEASTGFVVIYSIEDSKSFQTAEEILQRIAFIKHNKHKTVIVANKIDSQMREVSEKEGNRLGAKFGCKFLETSCATAENVQTAFKHLVSRDLTSLGEALV